jgi:hypothetical protein
MPLADTDPRSDFLLSQIEKRRGRQWATRFGFRGRAGLTTRRIQTRFRSTLPLIGDCRWSRHDDGWAVYGSGLAVIARYQDGRQPSFPRKGAEGAFHAPGQRTANGWLDETRFGVGHTPPQQNHQRLAWEALREMNELENCSEVIRVLFTPCIYSLRMWLS